MIKFIDKHAEKIILFGLLVAALVIAYLLYDNTKLIFVNQHLESELVETQNELNEKKFINGALESGQWEEEE